MNFFEKFFGYKENAGGIMEPYQDGLGAGLFTDWRHYVWIVLIIGLGFLLYYLFKRHKKAGKITVIVLVCLLFVTRFVNQTVRAAIGAEVPWTRAFPFHLCTMMTFVLPIVLLLSYLKPENKILANLKKGIYVMAMMGGIITVASNDYFDNAFMTFSTLEGMAAHTLLILIPIFEIALGNFRLVFKDCWAVFAGLVVLIGWASLANFVFFRAYDPNYMYLRYNGLPGDLGGKLYLLLYAVIFLIMLSLVYGIPTLYRYIVRRRLTKGDKKNGTKANPEIAN